MGPCVAFYKRYTVLRNRSRVVITAKVGSFNRYHPYVPYILIFATKNKSAVIWIICAEVPIPKKVPSPDSNYL